MPRRLAAMLYQDCVMPRPPVDSTTHRAGVFVGSAGKPGPKHLSRVNSDGLVQSVYGSTTTMWPGGVVFPPGYTRPVDGSARPMMYICENFNSETSLMKWWPRRVAMSVLGPRVGSCRACSESHGRPSTSCRR